MVGGTRTSDNNDAHDCNVQHGGVLQHPCCRQEPSPRWLSLHRRLRAAGHVVQHLPLGAPCDRVGSQQGGRHQKNGHVSDRQADHEHAQHGKGKDAVQLAAVQPAQQRLHAAPQADVGVHLLVQLQPLEERRQRLWQRAVGLHQELLLQPKAQARHGHPEGQEAGKHHAGSNRHSEGALPTEELHGQRPRPAAGRVPGLPRQLQRQRGQRGADAEEAEAGETHLKVGGYLDEGAPLVQIAE
mmetsp:Transcript_13999/g.44674  ORF Transcript_13999/g.44674 Transcript_13999/m.44674 type:complete len:241 (+) Transcript_13999:232-954(+)